MADAIKKQTPATGWGAGVVGVMVWRWRLGRQREPWGLLVEELLAVLNHYTLVVLADALAGEVVHGSVGVHLVDGHVVHTSGVAVH